MKLHIALVASAGLAFATSAAAVAPDKSSVELAQAGAAAAGSGTAQDGARPGDREMPFEDRVASFINEFYLSAERRTDEDLDHHVRWGHG